MQVKRAEREALEAAKSFPGQVQVVKLDALGPEADAYGLLVTPTVVLGDEVVARGNIVPARDLVKHIRRHLGG